MPILMYAASVANPSTRKKTVSAHLKRLQPLAHGVGRRAGEPLPLDRETIEPDAAVELDGEQQQDVQRPVAVAPDAVGRLERADQVRPRQHHVQVDGRQEEQREPGEHLPEPERGVLVPHQLHVTAEQPVLPPADRELAHGEHRVQHDQRDHAGDDDGHDARIRAAEDEVALEELRDRPHRVVADQDRRHEEHVSPHEQREQEAGGALQPVQARRPAAFRARVGKPDAGDDVRGRVHWRLP